MSEEEEPDLVFYGTPLEPYDEDAFPKRKPISLEDQTAKDSHGRRRFHGAFTGGFSAGFFNTVGSLEGWTPSDFKSTRSEKATMHVQKPEDFMDDEDIGEYGIAPQTVKATKDYSTIKKRSRKFFSDGPIPGEPVLESLITSGNETVGYLLLRNMGIDDKIKKKEQDVNPGGKIYGCEMPTQYQISEDINEMEYKIPEIYKQYLRNPKANTAGLGYKGLEKPHVNLFHSTNLVVRDKNDKRISIGGQAFGVGAFEDEDDDIYMKEDMSNYDFEITKEKEKHPSRQLAEDKLTFGSFEKSSISLLPKKQFIPPVIPQWFSGVHKVRKSRFEPLENPEVDSASRNQINPAIRARYLGEEVQETYTPSKKESDSSKINKFDDKGCDNNNASVDMASILSDRFVSASQKEDVTNILEEVKKSETLHGTQQMRDAAKMKMFGPLTRITSDWHPCSLLCKRFNVPEPYADRPAESKKRTKNLIFQAQKFEDVEHSLTPGTSRPTEEPNENGIDENRIKIEQEDISNMSTRQEILPVQNQNFEEIGKIEGSDTPKPIENETSDAPPIDFTEKIGIENKVDLYKAVFLSSSESEDETEYNSKSDFEKKKTEDDKLEGFKASLLSEPLIPQIKPIKEGILSGINFKEFNINRNKRTEVKQETEAEQSNDILPTPNPLLYGPNVPVQNIENKVNQNVTHKIFISSDSEDDWVEKDAIKKKKSKHKKRDKKPKHKKHKKKTR